MEKEMSWNEAIRKLTDMENSETEYCSQHREAVIANYPNPRTVGIDSQDIWGVGPNEICLCGQCYQEALMQEIDAGSSIVSAAHFKLGNYLADKDERKD